MVMKVLKSSFLDSTKAIFTRKAFFPYNIDILSAHSIYIGYP